MPRIYNRECDLCKNPYKGQGKMFCGRKCQLKALMAINKPPVFIVCVGCNKKVRTHPYRIKQGQSYCSSFCYGKLKIGVISPFQKKSLFKKGESPVSHYPECECFRCDRKTKNKHHGWKGGITSLFHTIRNCTEYKLWRVRIFERDNYTCVLCKDRSAKNNTVVLNVDHFPMSFSEIIKEFRIDSYEKAISCPVLWNLESGRTLCVACHKSHTKIQVKQRNENHTILK